MVYCDLHLHSTASDGTLTPLELVDKARLLGLVTISLTDHDTVYGCQVAKLYGEQFGLLVIPGVEINTEFAGHEVHILGYGFDPHDHLLLQFLSDRRADRVNRMVIMVERLRQLGLQITMDEVYANGQGRAVGRPHLARLLLAKGYVGSVKQAFDDYLGLGKKAYVPRSKLLPRDAIGALHRAGAIPVLAHPGLIGDDHIVAAMIEGGVIGIEAYHSAHSGAAIEHYRKMAMDRGLLITGGSDYHGPVVRGGEMGIPRVPAVVAEELVRVIEHAKSIACQSSE